MLIAECHSLQQPLQPGILLLASAVVRELKVSLLTSLNKCLTSQGMA